MRERWEGRFVESWDANDLVTLVNTWQTGDISKIRHDGDLATCLSGIQAKGLIMPSKSDLYFPVRIHSINIRFSDELLMMAIRQPEDSINEMSSLASNARLVVIDTIWGHTGKADFLCESESRRLIALCYNTLAGGGSNSEDSAFVQAQIKAFLEE
jgi:homoserine acetyltransferase